jgi:hypothetical protein
MDLNTAMSAHIRWKVRLLECIQGQAELPKATDMARDDACDLGQWMSGAGVEYASLASFRDAKKLHAAFHLRAAEVVSAAEKGDKRQAEAMLRPEGPFGLASDAVVLALRKLRSEVQNAGSPRQG